MAASKGGFAVLDIQNDDQEIGMDLQFQDFGDTRTQPAGSGGGGAVGGKHEQTILFSEFPDTAEDDQEHDKLMGEGEAKDPRSLKAGPSFWTFEFYQQFFDVESKQVGDRILWSMVPKPGVSYLQSYIRPNPDLYGPFWICLTLTFATGITGNLASYLAASTEETYVWRYEFRKVTLAASSIFAYAWLVPLAVWGVLALRGSRAKITLLELLSIYGYSLAIFVPVSVLWIVPQPWFKWCLAIVAPILSGSVLVRTVWPSLSHDSKQVAIGIAVVILLLHATLALGFMLYFFSPPEAKPKTDTLPVNPDTKVTTAAPKAPDVSPKAPEVKGDTAAKEKPQETKGDPAAAALVDPGVKMVERESKDVKSSSSVKKALDVKPVKEVKTKDVPKSPPPPLPSAPAAAAPAPGTAAPAAAAPAAPAATADSKAEKAVKKSTS
ncbi:protein YIPF1-like isoform X2 [Portunus trituberculatus]|uniref:protein YIPF1-like isoform X2 n=1 Tax=Portunus trituberculatus TaxID=210409 RepID=UPI001E1D1D9B|nr:protein YIPF1-like isoform X2 [Portunus trituberculatus]